MGTLFLSKHLHKLDGKGRVSLPASFRTVLNIQSPQQVILFRSANYACLDGVSPAFMETLGAAQSNFDLFSSEGDDMAITIFGEATPLNLDDTGRIRLPEEFIDHANLSDHINFIGLGRNFQIWDPVALKNRQESARKRVKAEKITLPFEKEAQK